MEIQQLRCFVAVADSGSFSSAAQLLSLTQPSLSQSVARLEAEFGAKLFHRSSKGTVLSEAGNVLVRQARNVLRAVDDTQETVNALRGLDTGTLTIAPYITFVTPVTKVVAAFRDLHPGVTIKLLPPSNTTGVHRNVESGAADIGFALFNDDIELRVTHDLLDITPVAVDESVAFVPRDSPIGGSEDPITLKEVAQLPVIAPSRDHPMRILLDRNFAAAGATPRYGVECEHFETSVDLVAQGLGTHITTRGAFPANPGPDVVVRPLTPARRWPVAMLRQAGDPSPASAAFSEVALKVFADEGADLHEAARLIEKMRAS